MTVSWRKRLVLWTGPGLFAGITFGDWFALLRDNDFAVDPPFWWRAAIITMRSIANSYGRWREEALYGESIQNVRVESPLFILGIWRSGTTHLHNLLALDERLATPNWYQVTYPHTFLRTERRLSRLEGFFVPRERVQDNMRFGYELPAEDEFALTTAARRSPMLSWVFPRRADYYDRYLTLGDLSQEEVSQWKSAFEWFVKKLTWKYRKPLALKSPPNTARIRVLLELFPDARFVHIHRDPYAVYKSVCHTHREVVKYVALQHFTPDIEGDTIRQYKEVYDAFFEERQLIPIGRYHEVRFENLERDPVGQMRAIYEILGLPNFNEVEPAIRSYTTSVAGYQKNVYRGISAATKSRIAREWRRCFEEWGYPI